MKRLLLVFLVCAVNSIVACGADGQVPPAAVYPGMWRQWVEPGGEDYIWSVRENLPAKGYALVDSAGNSVTLNASNWGIVEDSRDGASLTLPTTIPAGNYWLVIGNQKTATRVSVRLPPVPRRTTVLSPSGSDDSGQIQAAWNSGSDVVLSPGCYTIGHSVFRPPGASLRGVNRNLVVLTRTRNAKDGADIILFVGRGGYGGTISDLTVDCTTCPGAIFYLDKSLETNPNFLRLKLISVEIARLNSIGALFEDTETIHCGGRLAAGHTMLHGMSWHGVPARSMNELILGGDQNAVINCNWDLTCRGIVMRQGPTNSYFNSLDFDRVIQGTNANEVISAEDSKGIGVQNCLFTYVQIHGGRGAALELWYTPGGNNVFRCFDVDGGEGIWLESAGVQQSGNVFESWEMRNVCGIWLDQATGNTFNDFAIVNPRPSHCNEWDWRATTFTPAQAVVRGAAGNRFTKNFSIVGMPDGWNTGLEGIPR
ncbi:MAG TPA: hypothetical protein VHX86_18380 [Tepidisphaeraceae bacterium]|jgi:hypothetical protein|nr:hypothetical protein [Tepidisphaeraceae bacterium]